MEHYIWLLDEAPDLEGMETIDLLEEWALDSVEDLMSEESFIETYMKGEHHVP